MADFFRELKAGDILTALSILLATFGWMYSAWLQRQLTKRAHALDVLLAQDSNGELNRVQDLADAEIGSGQMPSEGKISTALRRTINFYEFISAAVRFNAIDEKLVVRTMRYRMLRMYDYTRELIGQLRSKYDNKRILEDFEWFATEKLHYEQWARTKGNQASQFEATLIEQDTP